LPQDWNKYYIIIEQNLIASGFHIFIHKWNIVKVFHSSNPRAH
jgi:hypothetical protein